MPKVLYQFSEQKRIRQQYHYSFLTPNGYPFSKAPVYDTNQKVTRKPPASGKINRGFGLLIIRLWSALLLFCQLSF
jgi:hypothetical protein